MFLPMIGGARHSSTTPCVVIVLLQVDVFPAGENRTLPKCCLSLEPVLSLLMIVTHVIAMLPRALLLRCCRSMAPAGEN